MAEHHRDKAERVAFVFMHVGAADTAPFDLDEDFTLAQSRDGKLAHFDRLRAEQNRARAVEELGELIFSPIICPNISVLKKIF